MSCIKKQAMRYRFMLRGCNILHLQAALVCRPFLFKKSMRKFNVTWWAYSFPLSFIALAAIEYALEGHMEWVAEVQFLGVAEHPNIIKLIGHCAVDGESEIERLLVYEFMQNKSLDDHLFNCAFPPLPWKTRLRIILGAAKGLAYLHEGLQVQVIYRGFKPSSLLLDEEFNPKLSNFGLAIEGPMAGHTHVSTVVMGTYGYAAPEYLMTGHLYVKSDVWSFGVVLYEILTGRRSIDRQRPSGDHNLLDWVKKFPAKSKKLRSIMDPRLENQYSIPEAREVAKLADTCLLNNPKERPKMSEVVERLKQIVQVTDDGSAEKMENRPKPKASESEIEAGIQENTAELLKIKYALESIVRAERKGKILLIIESNSTTAVKWIEDYESRPRELWLMLKDIDTLISQIGTVEFKIVV